MAVVTSIINLKGGVGKTTLTVALAHYLAIEHHRRVLVIDLDPQTNATVSLIREHDWKSRDTHGQTLYGLFRDLLDGTHQFNASTAIVANASNVGGGVFGLDLLPCSIRLIGLQDDLTRLARPGVALSAPVTALREALAGTLDTYDHVLIDCPPALGVVTQGGLLISDVFLVPVVPDILSLQGVVPVLDLIARIARRMGHHIAPLGTVVSKYNVRSRLHRRILEDLREGARQGTYPPLFTTLIPELARIAEASDVYASPRSLVRKYGPAHRLMVSFAREFLLRAERVSGVAQIAAVQRDLHQSVSRGAMPATSATPAEERHESSHVPT
ncbi:MAG TPA: ParA family protein [Ktedonobacterales bacterium]|jgi:chromosome partitioning protein|nr:ParA family protein [Ktedonobacterales bacterium]